ncbi:MAG: hypothetical protein VX944_01945 [Myxococcota bacterium]|nr:hypothetical protein [Myxococcota bacterium]
MLLLLLAACSTTAPPEPVAAGSSVAGGTGEAAEVVGPDVPTVGASAGIAAAPVPEATVSPVPVTLVWDGLSPLHQSFFSDASAVEQLGRDLAAHVQPPANVYVSFDSHRHIGRILLRLLPDTGVGLLGTDSDLLTGVSPVLQGLARYRDAVASRYDTRVAAFRIGVDSYRGTTHCRIGASGPLPPDGTVVDACVLINSQRVCGVPSVDGVDFGPSTVEALRKCLR